MRDKEGYSNNWYDVDNGSFWKSKFSTTLEFVVPKVDGDIYIQVETYSLRNMPSKCILGTTDFKYPNYSIELFKNGK